MSLTLFYFFSFLIYLFNKESFQTVSFRFHKTWIQALHGLVNRAKQNETGFLDAEFHCPLGTGT